MANLSRSGLVLIVTGSSLRAEQADRPLAYYLKQQVEQKLKEREDASTRFDVLVIADARWLHEDALQALPTIALGGPGVNLLTRRWLEEIPLSLAVDNRFYIQLDPELTEPRVCIWGMDNADTQIAVATFVQRFLPKYLDQCVEHPVDLAPFDTDSGVDDDD